MPINYIEKGRYLHEEIQRQGFSLVQADGVWLSDNDVAVQAIIDSFDPLPDAKREKIEELKAEGLRRANLVYDPDGIDDVFPSVGHFKLLMDIDDTYTRTGAPAARLVSLNQHLTAFENARTAINALTDLAAVESYDVVNTPSWPA